MSSYIGVIFTTLISVNAIFNDVVMKKSTMIFFSTLETTALRAFFSLITMSIYLLITRYKVNMKNIFKPFHLIRNVVTLGALVIVIYALTFMQINQVDLITYTIPIFNSIISSIFFKEPFSIMSFVLASICIAVCCKTSILTTSLMLFASSFLFAFAEVWIKNVMARKCEWQEMVISMSITSSIVLSYFLFRVLPRVTLYNIPFLIALGIGDWSIQYVILRATTSSNFRFLTPLRYLSIIFSVFADRIFFGYCKPNYINMATILGASLISILHSNRKKNNHNTH